MPIPREHLQERLSDAYIRAIVARAGFQYVPPDGAEYGIDGYIQEIQRINETKFAPTGYIIQVQIKAPFTCVWREHDVAYDMEAADYDKFVCADGPTPRILIVLALPRAESTWLECSEEALLLRTCCYWTQLQGPPSGNTSKKRVCFSRTQVFTPEALQGMFQRIRQGQW